MADRSVGVGRLVAGLWCSEVLDRLPDLVDGTLDVATRGQVQMHLHGCTACARFGGRYGALVQTLRNMPAAVDEGSMEALLRRVVGRGG